MKKQMLLFFTVLTSVQIALAATVTLHNDYTLPEIDPNAGEYWAYFIFEEGTPGVMSDNVIARGCAIHLYSYSKVQLLPKGDYKVVRDTATSPSVWDGRWYRDIVLEWGSDDFSIVCKTGGGPFISPITDAYVNKLTTGFLTLN